MSRMDKYKKIHEESQKEEKKPFGFRREMKKEKQPEKRDFEDINENLKTHMNRNLRKSAAGKEF